MAATPFQNNVIILTGASAGIGHAMALQLADQGAHLMLAARDASKLEAVAAECESRGGRACIQPTDVGVEADCRMLIERTIAEFGRIDTLVNNAGISMWARFDQMQDIAPFEELMRVNYFGAMWCTHYALPHLKQSRGRIVAMSSLAGKTGVPMRSGYSATKHAMQGFFDSLRIELRDTGVSVTIICPGFVTSEIRERAFKADGTIIGKGNSPVQETKIMSAEECARISIRAMASRRREVVMGLRGKVGQWIKLIAPGIVDRIAAQAVARGR
jgi:short-subunit dehydrogenase